jgi:ABC-type phosphate transport system substrate-binding protein
MAQRLRHLLPLLVALTVGSVSLPAMSQEKAEGPRIAIIVSRLIPLSAIDNSSLRNIYLKKVFLDAYGHAYVPVNLPATAELRREFTRTIIHWNETQLQTYWNRQYFQGVSPPYVVESQAAMVEFVAKTPGAIGYVWSCFANAKVKVIFQLTVHAPMPSGVSETCPTKDTR